MPTAPFGSRLHRAVLPSIEDQQLAGIVMLLPGGLIYLGTGLALLAAWLDAAGRRRTA